MRRNTTNSQTTIRVASQARAAVIGRPHARRVIVTGLASASSLVISRPALIGGGPIALSGVFRRVATGQSQISADSLLLALGAVPVYYTKVKTAHTWQTTCTSPDNTVRLAAAIGRQLRGGEVIELVSDLGGGKTTFVRGLAEGAGSTDTVSSPSFTLTNQYEAKELKIYHFDFYRLHEAGIVRDELAEVLADPRAVVVVEWAEITADTLPTERLTVTIRPTGETTRELIFQYPATMDYLFPDNT